MFAKCTRRMHLLSFASLFVQKLFNNSYTSTKPNSTQTFQLTDFLRNLLSHILGSDLMHFGEQKLAKASKDNEGGEKEKGPKNMKGAHFQSKEMI